jgi:hypothetical protein
MNLEDINKKNIFKVPDQYFEEFPERLQDRIRKESKKREGKLISLPPFVRMAVAASVLILITFVLFLLQNNQPSVDQLLAEVPTESLIAYLEESDMSVDELIETIDVGLINSDDDFMDPTLIPDQTIDENLIQDIITDYELDMEM